MTDVKHMKWWGWGNEGVGFHWQDKPGFADFVQYAVGLDLHTAEPVGMPSFDKMTIPKSLAGKPLLASLATIVGEGHVTTDDMERVVHVYGKSLRDLVRIRANQVQRYPDVVVYPADEAEVQKIVDAAVAADVVIIPFGGGSNIAGSLEPRADEKRVILSLDMGRLRKVIDIDEESGLARIEAGAQGPDLEEQLNAKGWTIGHFPDSFTHSTIGGWVATRSSGMQSDKYGDISDIARGLRVVRPGGTLVVRPHPSASNGPSVKEMILGSEGRLGVITEVTAQVHRVPAKRDVYAYFFPNWDAGIAAMQEIAESDAAPSITRISDGPETGFSLATSKERHGFDKFAAGTVLPTLMKAKGWKNMENNICLSFIGFEGEESHAKRQKKLVDKIVAKHNGLGVGTGPGVLYDQKKFDTPYLRDFLLDRGAAGDVSETAMPWSKVDPGARRGDRRRAQGVRRARHQGLDHEPHVALVPLGRVPVLHVRVRLRQGPAGRVRPRQERDPAGVRRQRLVDLAPPRRRPRARPVAGAGHLGRGRQGRQRAVLGDRPGREPQPAQDHRRCRRARRAGRARRRSRSRRGIPRKAAMPAATLATKKKAKVSAS